MRFVVAAGVSCMIQRKEWSCRKCCKVAKVTDIIKRYQRNGEFEFFVSQGADYQMYFIRTDERNRGTKRM